MFKQLLRSSHALSLTRGTTVILPSNLLPTYKRSKSSEDLRKTFAETFGYIVRQTGMDIDQKMKELSELFSKTGKELSELVKRNERFILGEIRRVEEAVRVATEVRARGKMDRLRDVKSYYAERIKICNEKATTGLRAAKEKCDQRVEAADSLRNSMKQILKECLETDEFVKCIASGAKEAVKRRKQITAELKETVKSAELSVAEQLKEGARCHADAQAAALQSLHKILKDTKDCL